MRDNDGRKLDHQTLEAIRIRAVQQIQAGAHPEDVAESLDMDRSTSIFRNIVREYSEELLGQPEHDGSSGRPIDYERWPFFRAMEKAHERSELRLYILGVALNALSLNATIMTAAVIESTAFDSLFRDLAQLNAEGEVVARLGDDKERRGVAFDESTINHLLHVKPQVSPNAMAGLSLAWQHREVLLGA